MDTQAMRMAPLRAGVASPPAREGAGLRAARVMSAVILLLMVVASVGGLWSGGLYQDPASVGAMLRAYDLVTLLIVVPALAVVLLPWTRRSPGAQLVWLSALVYAVYNYAIYAFGSAFNDLFLVHVAVFSLSVFALALALANLDVVTIAIGFRAGTPVRSISVLLLLPAVGLGAMWGFYALRFAFTGAAPEESLLVLPTASVHLGYVLDLALLVPGYALAAVLLWRRAPWGYVLATLMATFGTVYQLSYMTALIFQTNAKVPGATSFDPAEPFIAGVFAIAAALLFGSLRTASRKGEG